MTYLDVSLKWTAIVIGLIYVAAHLPTALAPARLTPWLRGVSRNYPLGVVLMLAATIWFVWLTGVMDLGEISNVRTYLMLAWGTGGVLMAIFVPGFLAARALGCLLLLGAAVIIDAAFLVETPVRYVMTLLAYVWIIKGMVLVYSPHLWRDIIDFATKTPERLRLVSWPGVAFGLLLIALGIFVYPDLYPPISQ
jgi:uncharacterized protein YjeT (DUF2065 family)